MVKRAPGGVGARFLAQIWGSDCEKGRHTKPGRKQYLQLEDGGSGKKASASIGIKAVNTVFDLILCADLFHNLSRFDIVKDWYIRSAFYCDM